MNLETIPEKDMKFIKEINWRIDFQSLVLALFCPQRYSLWEKEAVVYYNKNEALSDDENISSFPPVKPSKELIEIASKYPQSVYKILFDCFSPLGNKPPLDWLNRLPTDTYMAFEKNSEIKTTEDSYVYGFLTDVLKKCECIEIRPLKKVKEYFLRICDYMEYERNVPFRNELKCGPYIWRKRTRWNSTTRQNETIEEVRLEIKGASIRIETEDFPKMPSFAKWYYENEKDVTSILEREAKARKIKIDTEKKILDLKEKIEKLEMELGFNCQTVSKYDCLAKRIDMVDDVCKKYDCLYFNEKFFLPCKPVATIDFYIFSNSEEEEFKNSLSEAEQKIKFILGEKKCNEFC